MTDKEVIVSKQISKDIHFIQFYAVQKLNKIISRAFFDSLRYLTVSALKHIRFETKLTI